VPHPDPVGAVLAILLVGAIGSTLYRMLHAPTSPTEMIAEHATEQAQEITGVILIVFSRQIRSEVLVALAARMAKGRQARLVAIYIIEVPYTLPIDAELPDEEREALGVLTAAEEIGRKIGVEITSRTIRDRQTGPAVIQAAKEEGASLIVMGTYREHRYAGAPLGQAIEYVLAHTQTDAIVGVSSATGEESMLSLGALPNTLKRS
jgi:nucleotide-binding universal stress UspA family protein